MADYVLIAGGLKRGGNGRFLQSAAFSSYVFDAVTSITFQMSANPTKHPVDSKATISDHIIQENDVFTLNVVISDTPIDRVDGNKFTYGSSGTIKKRSVQAFQELKRRKEDGTVFILATEFGVFPNCIIKDISGTITPNNINAYQFAIQLERIRIATAQSVNLTEAPEIQDQVAINESKGSSDKEDVTEGSADRVHFDNFTAGAINDFLGVEVLPRNLF